MEFRKQKRNAKVLLLEEWRFWRLASVEEVKRNMERIKQEQILESWDICRLLDGWVCGPGYRYEVKDGYRDDPMGDMLLVKTAVRRSRNGEFNERMYSGVQLNSEGLKYALLFSCQDKITEVMCFVLKSTIDKFQDKGKRQAELDRFTESLKETFNQRRTVLHYAADQPYNETHARCVAELILKNFEYGKELIKASDKYGRTALHLAALHGYVDLCTCLMSECGLKADEKDRNGENVLHLVANGNNISGLRRLLQMEEVKSLVASQDGKGKTPLHKAAANGNTRFIEALAHKAGGSSEEYVRQSDLFGQTALHEAASGGHCEAVKYLLEKGSKPLLERNSEGKTALHYCVQIPDQKRAKDIAELLLQHCGSGEERLLLLWASATGMGTAEQSAESSSTVHCFLKQQRNNETKAERASDLLLSAVKLGYDALAWELINRGANTSQLHNLSKDDLSHAHRERVHKFLKRVEKMPEGGRDQPTIHDSLGRRAFAEGLAALFLNPYVKSPVTVGISGDWGMGKSSLMLQTEMILLQAAAQLAFPDILPIEDFPGSKQYELTQKGVKKYKQVKNGVKDLLPLSEIAEIGDPLVYFLDNYQDEYSQVYKSLALMDRSELFRLKDNSSDSSSNLGKIPTILTIRYNAWHYQNELEALAGLAVTVTKAMEETMTKSQRIRSCWRYTWKERGGEIRFQFLLPCLLALFLSCWLTWAVWMLLNRSNHSEFKDLKYGSIPVTLVVLFWTVMKKLHSVFKPVSVQLMGYVRLHDHCTNLGYQHQVISDINFLKNQIREKPSLFWKFVAGNWLWRMCGLYLDTVEGTSIPKTTPPSKDDTRIIVFVDDLDRCQDNVILQVLSAVNLVLAVCEINVILGMDKKMIARAIAHQYQHQLPENSNLCMIDPVDLAEKYLSKIVQLPLALPDSGNDERIQFLNQQLGEQFKEGGDDQTKESNQSSTACQSRDTETIPQKGTESLSDGKPSDVENPHEYPPQKVQQSGPEIYQFMKCFKALRRRIYGWIYSGPHIRSSKLKSVPINSQLILPSYSDEERKAMVFLSTQASDGPQLPREWKRFLTYHRLAWNILFRLKQVKNLAGWQVQLLVWIFCCWQWKDNINLIIKKWKELVSMKGGTINDEDPSLKIIVEHYLDKLKEPFMESDKWDLLNKTLDKYDVPMESIQSFQKFRLHCEIGYLPRPPATDTEPMSNTSAENVEAHLIDDQSHLAED